MSNKKGSRELKLRNGDEEWDKFCSKTEALAYVARGWCTAEDVATKWPEKVNNDDNNGVSGEDNENNKNDVQRSAEEVDSSISLLDMQKQVTLIESSQEQVLYCLANVSSTMSLFKESIAELMSLVNYMKKIQSDGKVTITKPVLNNLFQQLSTLSSIIAISSSLYCKA
jgi:soluble cytochrome b562